MLETLIATLLVALLPALLMGTIGGGFGYLLGRLNIPYTLVEWLPWRTVMVTFAIWLAHGLATIRIFGLGPLTGVLTSTLLAFTLGFAVALTLSLEAPSAQRAVNAVRGVIIVAFIIGLYSASLTGGGGLLSVYIRSVTLGIPGDARLALVQLAGVTFLLDLLGSVAQAVVARLNRD